MTKTLCKKKKTKDHDAAKFRCKKCKEKASKKKDVCKPEKMNG